MYSSLTELNLHDSKLIDFRVIHPPEGLHRIELYLSYIEDYDSLKTRPVRLVFINCRRADLKLSLGFRPPDTILQGEEVYESDMLESLKLRLKDFPSEMVESLKHYRIETVNSDYDIIATDLALAEWDGTVSGSPPRPVTDQESTDA